jgi:hypothetical protein
MAKKPTFDRAVSAKNAKDLRRDNLQPTENVAILDNPETHQEEYHSWGDEAITPSITHSNAKDVKARYEQDVEDQHEYHTKVSSNPRKGYTKKDAARDIEGYPISGDDLAKMRGKSLYSEHDRDGYDVNNHPVSPPNRAHDESRRPVNLGA